MMLIKREREGEEHFCPLVLLSHLSSIYSHHFWMSVDSGIPLFLLLSIQAECFSKSFQSTIHLLSISCVLLLFLFSPLHWCGDCSNFSGDFSATTGGSSSLLSFSVPLPSSFHLAYPLLQCVFVLSVCLRAAMWHCFLPCSLFWWGHSFGIAKFCWRLCTNRGASHAVFRAHSL